MPQFKDILKITVIGPAHSVTHSVRITPDILSGHVFYLHWWFLVLRQHYHNTHWCVKFGLIESGMYLDNQDYLPM